MSASEHSEKKGGDTWQQVISSVRHTRHPQNSWGVEQTSNANNAWYVNLSNGSISNNNKTNAYMAFPVADYIEELDEFFRSEGECFRNKKSRLDANRCHYHLAEIWSLIYKVLSRTYTPDKSVCFVLDYPVYREVFAAQYWDRVAHHIVAPYISAVAEQVHYANGDVSHGNRKNHSILTAVSQIQEAMRQFPNGYVMRFDIQGFFMSLDREFVLEVFAYFEQKYPPHGYTEEQRECIRYLIRILVMSDPAINCVRHSPIWMWDNVAPNKSLFNNTGKGLPIGNYYSQILAVLTLALFDCELCTPHLVDDFCIIAPTKEEMHRKFTIANEIAQAAVLKIHPKKIYVQPVRHGVPFCGRFVYPNRVYMGNRSVTAFKWKVYAYMVYAQNEKDAARFMASFNSYTGMMKHTAAFNIQVKAMHRALDSPLREYVYFKTRKGQIVCQLKTKYKKTTISRRGIEEINNKIKYSDYGSNYYWSQKRLPKTTKARR